MFRLLFIGLVILFPACSGHPSYTKAGASEEDLKEAMTSCQAQLPTINVRVSGPVSNPVTVGGGMAGPSMAARQKAVDECLRAKGWEP